MKATPWRLAGAILCLGGVALVAGAAMLFSRTSQMAADREAALAAADTFCKRQLSTIGQVSDKDGEMAVTVPNVVDPHASLGDATAALAVCPSRTLVSFCLGSGCSTTPGAPVSMTFRLSKH